MQYIFDRIVNKAIQKSQSAKVSKLKIRTWSPDITISRDPGSGGRIIAQKIAKKLGWQLFDKSLVIELAQELGLPEDEIIHIDEHGRSWFADFFQSIFNPDYVSDIRYISHLKKLLSHAAKKGDLVILGHGANIILPPDKCLRVRITANRDTRITNTFKYEHFDTKEEATLAVDKAQNKYNQFIRQYFGTNPHNPWNYDLVISTDHLTLDQATDLIIQAYLAKFPSEKRKLKSKLSK